MASDPALPSYSPRTLPPSYSSSPKSTEQTLQRSSAAGPSRIAPSGYFIERNDSITLLLKNQDGSAPRPSTGPGAFLEGTIILELTERENVRAVEMRIDGWLESLPLPGAHSSVDVVSVFKPLYSSASDIGSCPNNLPFSHRFPSIFSHGENTFLLPPTCHIQFNNAWLFIKCTYRITATVVAQKHTLPVFRKEHRISVDLDYHPQTTPFQPMLENPSFLGTVKSCPEEWTQIPMSALDVSGPGSSGVVCDYLALLAQEQNFLDVRRHPILPAIVWAARISTPNVQRRVRCLQASTTFGGRASDSGVPPPESHDARGREEREKEHRHGRRDKA